MVQRSTRRIVPGGRNGRHSHGKANRSRIGNSASGININTKKTFSFFTRWLMLPRHREHSQNSQKRIGTVRDNSLDWGNHMIQCCPPCSLERRDQWDRCWANTMWVHSREGMDRDKDSIHSSTESKWKDKATTERNRSIRHSPCGVLD